MEDRFDRAFWNACFAVDAFVWMDVKHRVGFVEALDWADDDAVGVFAIVAGFGDDVRHGGILC